ncbi:MAG TPA: Ig-like domain repeat protein, partial [Xanthomonadales bacterium]|nr:Ig-like domain repeat protein [Xanthomonadales bacterium]
MRYACRSRQSFHALVAIALLACASTTPAASWISNGTCVEAVYTVPPAITRLHVTALGSNGEDGTSDLAGGHFGNGGKGGYGTKMVASVDVTPGQVLYVGVADPYSGTAPQSSGHGGGPGVGVNIGPTNIAGAGGSATFIALNDPRVGGGCAPIGANLLLVASGGGGGGGAASFANGGAGGTETVAGGNGAPGGTNRQDDGAGGAGATLAGGGAGGNNGSSPTCISGTPGATGNSMQGGRGGDGGSSPGGTTGCQPANARAGTGAGGGAGYFGGGGGGGGSDNSGGQAAAGGGGGAGLSYRSAAVTLDQPLSRACLGVGCSLPDEPVVTIVPFDTPPVVTSPNTLTLTAGTVLTNVTLRAAGWPVPDLAISNLPAGVLQQSLGDGELALGGEPTFYAGGVRVATLTASNTDSAGVYHATTQAVTITVNATPRFTNPTAQASIEVGTFGSLDLASNYGWPIPALTIVGTLPPGMALVDEGDGTGRIAGTPTQGGIYDVTLRASNGIGTAPTQAIRLRIVPIPETIVVGSTQNPSQPGQDVSFTAQLQPIPDCDTYVRFLIDGVQFGNYLPTNGLGFTQTSQVTSLASGPHTITAESTGGCGYAPGSGQATQVVTVVSGPASGTKLTATPAGYSAFVASGRVYDATLGGLDTGIPSSGLGGIAIDGAGNTFTFAPDLGNVRLRRTAPDGTFAFIGPSGFTHGAYGIAVDGAGNAYAAERDRITRVTPGGGFAFVASNAGYYIRQVAADSAGNVFFSNYAGSYGEVLQVTPPYTGQPTLVATGFGQVGGLAVDSANNLFVSDPTVGKVYRYSLVDGTRTTVVTGFTVDALAIDGAATLYLGIGDLTARIAAPYTPNAAVEGFWQGYPPAGIATRPRVSAPFGQPLVLKSTTISAPSGGFPAGTVTFRDGATPIGTVALNGVGVATLSTSSLSVGTHAITATYNGSAGFPTSVGSLNVVVTKPPVPVTVTGIRVRGSQNVAFAYTVGTLPPGVTAVTGTLAGCASSTLPSASIGTYQNTIFGCAGLSLAGPNGASYDVQYVDGGVTITPQPLPILVAGRLVVATSGITFSWTTPITLPTGTTIAGSLTGCASSVNAATPLGLYNGTITGCTGLSVTGPAAPDYALAYVDAGVEVVPLAIAVTVTATKPFGGGVVPTFSYVPQATFPSGVTGVGGTLTGCTSSVVPTTPPGTYNGTITGCGGLSAQGPQAPAYSIEYIDGGITVTDRGVAVNVSGFQVPGGTPLFRYSVAGGFPRDIYSANGPISGCTTTVTAATPPGTYAGTIGGCGGLLVFTDTGVTYAITYVDAGFTVGNAGTTTHIAPTTGTDPDLLFASAGPRHLILQPPPYTQPPVLLNALVASGAAFDSSGNLVSSDIEGLRIYDPGGTLRRVVTTGIFLSPIALDSHDNVFGVVLENNVRASIWRVDWPYTGPATLVKEGFGGVSTILFDSSDRLWIGDQFGRFPSVLEPPYTGAPLIVVQPPLSSAGFTVDGEGSFFNGRNSNGPGQPARVDKFVPPYTDPPVNFTGDIPSSNAGPRLVADRQGNLFGGDSLGLLRIPASGGPVARLNNDNEFRGPLGFAASSPPARAIVGSPVSVTITVASIAGGTPTGTVRVFEGATQVGSGTLVGGKATISIPGLAEGTHFLTASYLGAAPYLPSGSNKLRAVIGRDSPTILFTTPPPLANGASASVGAVATSSLGVTFAGSGACTVAANGTVTGTAAGTCTITANSAGNGTFLPALQTTITLPVAKGSQ